MSQATDLMLDLKTGYLVGATPRMQQIGQFVGAWLGPIVVIGLIFVLHEAMTLGSDSAAGAAGAGTCEHGRRRHGRRRAVEKYAAGAILGGILSALIGGLGVTVGLGFYLPFNIVLTYSLGTLGREVADRFKGKSWSEKSAFRLPPGLSSGRRWSVWVMRSALCSGRVRRRS